MSIVIIAKGLVVGAVAGTTLVAGNVLPHAATDAKDAASAGDSKVACHQLWRHAPAGLKRELRQLRTLPRDQRRAGVKEIRKDALAGDYGTRVQTVVEHRKALRRQWLKSAPQELRQDLRTAIRQPAGDARKDAVKAVRQSALDGKYGDTVQARAEQRKAHHATCRAQREQRTAQQG